MANIDLVSGTNNHLWHSHMQKYGGKYLYFEARTMFPLQ